MAQPKTIEGRELTKFVESPTRDNSSAVETVVGNTYDNPIPVDPTTRGTPDYSFNEVNSLGSDTLTILNITVGIGLGVDLFLCSCSGDNVSIFSVEINDSVIDKKRLTWGKFNTEFKLANYELSDGDNVKVKVENKRNKTGTFNATLYYSEYNL